MSTPGRYKHYKGGEYRVLFTAFWIQGAPSADAELEVFIMTNGTGGFELRVYPAQESSEPPALLRARWAGGHVEHREPVVVYANLDGVFVRPVREFDEFPLGRAKRRFWKVGP